MLLGLIFVIFKRLDLNLMARPDIRSMIAINYSWAKISIDV